MFNLFKKKPKKVTESVSQLEIAAGKGKGTKELSIKNRTDKDIVLVYKILYIEKEDSENHG